MFETLTRGFREARDRLRGVTSFSEDNLAEPLREIRMSLLEADVDLTEVRTFLDAVKQRCLGSEVALRTGKRGKRQRVSLSDRFTKACYEELCQLLGADAEEVAPRRGARTLMLLGLQGTGKTSSAAKLALHLKKGGERPLLVAADVHRPAAIEQLRVLGAEIEVEVFHGGSSDAAEVCRLAVAHAAERGLDSVILDTAGRLQIDENLMDELDRIAEAAPPDLSLLVCDAMMGREAVNVARGFAERRRLDGLVLTKLDGDSRGGAALAIRQATGVPIRFISVGEAPDRLEPFQAEGLASRILGMGDVVSLMRDFEAVADTEQAEQDAERMLKGQFTLEDFLSQLRTIQKMGPLKDLMGKLPGMQNLLPDGVEVDGRELKKIEAMILSMTRQERMRPELIDRSRSERIARGSGTRESDLSGVLERFGTMRKLMKNLGQGGGLLGKIPGLGKLSGSGMQGLEGMDPAALIGGGAPNRRAARATKADDRRKQRKQKRKHQRRGRRR